MEGRLMLLLLLLFVPLTWAQFTCNNGNETLGNPIGTCACEGHLWVSDDCSQGFHCHDTLGNGCHLECPPGFLLQTSFTFKTWDCYNATAPGQMPMLCPVGGYNICPSDNVASTIDPGGVTSNPLGTCRCDGELWVAEGCTYAFHCNSTKEDGGDFIQCGDGQVVTVDFAANTWACSDDVSTCPGGQINGVGCKKPECDTYALNNLGDCECDEQFFISPDCKTGFYCQTNIPDPFAYDGCIQTCAEGQILIPDFAHKTWQCVPNDNNEFMCPGAAKIECPANDIGDAFTSEDCDCPDGQLLVSGDCRNAFFCASRMLGGGTARQCPEGQIIDIDLHSWRWSCKDDDGQCPGMGGFKLGCLDAIPTLPPDSFECQVDTINPHGECGCNGQLFINRDCTQGFYCNDNPETADVYEGCSRTCAEGEILVPNFAFESGLGGWACIDNWNNHRRCPGEFNIECPSGDPGHQFDASDCDCDGQIMVDSNCQTAFYCLSRIPNGGTKIECADGEILDINLSTYEWQCIPDNGNCPGLGGYKMGCKEGAPPLPPIDCQGGEYSTYNPLGNCKCDGNLWVNSDCSQGYYCVDMDGAGCHIQCPEGTILSTNFTTTTWSCRTVALMDDAEALQWTACPIGGFDLCPTDNVATTPNPDEITGNPLGICRCDGEVWVSEGCSYGFHCDSTQEIGGEYLSCPEGQVLLVNPDDHTWQCTSATSTCYGAIEGVGCNDLACQFSKNHLGTCECDQQLFISANCQEGFFCDSHIPDSFLYDGCTKKCLNNQFLIPNFNGYTWDCIDKTDKVCPGAFNVSCPNTPGAVPEVIQPTDCSCDGELIVSSDCRHSFWCFSRMGGGGRRKDCPVGEILHLNVKDYTLNCVVDDGSTDAQCPGMGGFRMGCGNGRPVPQPPVLECDFGQNDACECPGQVFIMEDCRESFYCTTNTPDNTTNGCRKVCGENQRVRLDVPNNDWECVDVQPGYVCPGEFNLDCEDNFRVQCNCRNEVWMNGDCTQAYICSGPYVGGINPGQLIDCPLPSAPYLDIDFNDPFTKRCTNDSNKCPGSFHLGCNAGDPWTVPSTTTRTTTRTTTTTTPPLPTTWPTATTTDEGEGGQTTTTGASTTTTSAAVGVHVGGSGAAVFYGASVALLLMVMMLRRS